MNRGLRYGIAAAGLLLGTSSLALGAHAQETGPAFGWTGFHVDATAGYGVARHRLGFQLYEYMDLPFEGLTPGQDVFSLGASIDLGGRGDLWSLGGGFDVQIGHRFVLGVLGDYTWAGMEGGLGVFGAVCYEMAGPDDCDTATISDEPRAEYLLTTGNSWSVLARAGLLANPRTLFYVLGGYTNTTLAMTTQLTSDPTGVMPFSSTTFQVPGWTFGFGAEFLVTPNVSAGIQYRGTRFGYEDVTGDPTFGFRTFDDVLVHTVRATLSYRYGGQWGPTAADPYAAEPADWTGFHMGTTAGFGSSHNVFGFELYDYTAGGLLQLGGFPGTIEGFDLFSIGAEADLVGTGHFASITAGYDFQVGPHFVFGVLGDYTFANITSTAQAFWTVCYDVPAVCNDPQDPPFPEPNAHFDIDLTTGNTWTVGGRAGISAGGSLFYALAAYSEVDMALTVSHTDTAGVTTEYYNRPFERRGITFGGGIEAMITPNLSANVEYRGTLWNHEEVLFGDDVTGFRVFNRGYVQTIRGGLSWRFGG